MRIKSIIVFIAISIFFGFILYSEIEKKIASDFLASDFIISASVDLYGNKKSLENDQKTWIQKIVKNSIRGSDPSEKGELLPSVLVLFQNSSNYSMLLKIDSNRKMIYTYLYKQRTSPILILVYKNDEFSYYYNKWTELFENS